MDINLVVGLMAVGMIGSWVGYYMGYRAGMKTGAMLASIDPNAQAWWR